MKLGLMLIILAIVCSLLERTACELNEAYLRGIYCDSLVNDDEHIQLNWDDYDVDKSTSTLSNRPSLSQVQQILAGKRGHAAKSIDLAGMSYLFRHKYVNSSSQQVAKTIIDLFFVSSFYNTSSRLKDTTKAKLTCLNLTMNSLEEGFLDPNWHQFDPALLINLNLYQTGIVPFFSRIALLKLSYNKLERLERDHFTLFPNVEVLLLDHNQLTSIKHSAFYDLAKLKYLYVNNNRLKIVHPLSFSHTPGLVLVNLAQNRLKAVFKTASDDQSVNNFTLANLKYFYLAENEDISCDCGLLWLYRNRNGLILDDFKCKVRDTEERLTFNRIDNESVLTQHCKMPNLYVNTAKLDETSRISFFREASKRWFAWTVFVDDLPTTTPFPYLASNETNIDELDSSSQSWGPVTSHTFDQQEKHVFHTWQLDNAVFECSNKKDATSEDDSKSTIIWKTQFGYLSNLDSELVEAIKGKIHLNDPDDEYGDDNDHESNTNSSQAQPPYFNSFKLFYKMNRLTKIYKNFTVKIGRKFGEETRSNFYVRRDNKLVVTNMRQAVSGPFVCISLNERGVKMYEYDMRIRAGVSEYFIYSLFLSVISMIVPSILGVIVCCICEYQADKNYPTTPPCYPTPMASTPPNFDIWNEWMANAASYLPNLNIQETLEQVSKRLKKGMEKASVTVKSFGMTSSAYIYSMYEQSSQRWSGIKQYVPTLNVPNLTLPTMRYPPTMGQLANRMRVGMGNVFIHFREFCGTSDLTHTASIVDLEADTNAANAVGKTYIIDTIGLKQPGPGRSNYYRFLHFIKEEPKQTLRQTNTMDTDLCDEADGSSDDTPPSTSSQAAAAASATATAAGDNPCTSTESNAGTALQPNQISIPLTSKLPILNINYRKSYRNGINYGGIDDDDDDDNNDSENDDPDYYHSNPKSPNGETKRFLGKNFQLAAGGYESEDSSERTSKIDPNLLKNSNQNT